MGSLAASLWESNNTGDSLNSIFKKPLFLSLSFHLLDVSSGSETFWKPQLYMLDALAERELWRGGMWGEGVEAQRWGSAAVDVSRAETIFGSAFILQKEVTEEEGFVQQHGLKMGQLGSDAHRDKALKIQ